MTPSDDALGERITEAEHGPSWSHRLGFPRPTEAVLEGAGVGSGCG